MSRKISDMVAGVILLNAFVAAVGGGVLQVYKSLYTKEEPPAASNVQTGCDIKAAAHKKRIDDAIAGGYTGHFTSAEDVRAECIKGSPGYDAGGGRHP